MTELTRTIINCETGIAEVVALTAEEISNREQMYAEMEAYKAEQEAQRLAVEALKESARAKLVAGEPLTAEEAAVVTL